MIIKLNKRVAGKQSKLIPEFKIAQTQCLVFFSFHNKMVMKFVKIIDTLTI
jgi:hypothetical protein